MWSLACTLDGADANMARDNNKQNNSNKKIQQEWISFTKRKTKKQHINSSQMIYCIPAFFYLSILGQVLCCLLKHLFKLLPSLRRKKSRMRIGSKWFLEEKKKKKSTCVTNSSSSITKFSCSVASVAKQCESWRWRREKRKRKIKKRKKKIEKRKKKKKISVY